MVNPQRSKTPEKPILQRPGRAQPQASPPSESAINLKPTTPEGVLQLQRLIGNQATRRIIRQQESVPIQRFPARAAIIKRVGKTPHRRRRGSKRYKELLDLADTYNDHIKKTNIGSDLDEIKSQFTELAHMLDAIGLIINEYKGGRKSSKKTQILTLENDLNEERKFVSNTLIRYVTNPPPINVSDRGGTLLASAINSQMNYSNTVNIDPRTQGNTQQGGMKSVTEYTVGGTSGFFKEQQDTLYNPAPGEDRDKVVDKVVEQQNAELEGVTDEAERTRIKGKYSSKLTEYDLAVDTVGIDPDNARMTQRDVAMSLIDSLLEANVIARAQFAIMNVPGAQKTGGFMESAKGSKASDLYDSDAIAKNSQSKTDPGQISAEDPTLFRLLSRLQLIDLLALQIDRGLQNYFIEYDSSGKILGITGIDNDLALGKNVGIEQGKFPETLKGHQLPGISRFVDKELAQRILQLDAALLRLLLVNLLSPAELLALTRRLSILQNALKSAESKLLQPEDWKDHIDAVMHEGVNKSYAATLRDKLEWQRN